MGAAMETPAGAQPLFAAAGFSVVLCKYDAQPPAHRLWTRDVALKLYPEELCARFDDDRFVNQAHNDWLQWASEAACHS